MLSLTLLPEVTHQIISALRDAGQYEIGGVLMGEHVGENEFRVTEISIHRRGTFSSFIRRVEDALGRIKTFFQKNQNNYSRFNYLGEWHSHPMFAPYPSSQDDYSMLEIIMDEAVGANFVVLLIVKLNQDSELVGSLHTYLPNGSKVKSSLVFEH